MVYSQLSVGELNTGAWPRHGSPVSANDTQIDGVAAGLRVSGSGPGGGPAGSRVQGAALRGTALWQLLPPPQPDSHRQQTQMEGAIQD